MKPHWFKHWDWLAAGGLSLLASWWYFFGTPFILGLDYFTHLAQGYVIKTGIEQGCFIPAYDPLYASGKIFIRYQAMLLPQFMGWLCLLLEKVFGLSGPSAIMYTGRITCVAINFLTGISFYYGVKKWIPIPTVSLTGTAAYLYGWQRLGVVLHVGALQRAAAFALYPVCFSLLLLSFQRRLTTREQVIFGIALAACLLTHPLYSLKAEDFRFDPQVIVPCGRLQFATHRCWQGKTAMTIACTLPIGEYPAIIVLPVYLPPQSELILARDSISEAHVKTQDKGRYLLLEVPSKGSEEVHLNLWLTDGSHEESIMIGLPSQPAILYGGPCLAYRLALTDTRFIALNLAYLKVEAEELISLPYFQKVYYSGDSALYENLLSRPFFFPVRIYLIKGPKPWEFFNQKVAHHPLYDPHVAGFCYEGNPEDFDGGENE